MSRQQAVQFTVAAVALVLVNCGGRLSHAGDGWDIGTGGADSGGSGGAGGNDSGGSGGAGGNATGGSGGVGVGGSTGGSTGGTGVGGRAGQGGSPMTDGGSGNPFIDLLPGLNLSPICKMCLNTQCGSVIAKCSYTASCVAGTACTMSNCSTFADTACTLKCFNGDMRLAQDAIDAAHCAYVTCAPQCR